MFSVTDAADLGGAGGYNLVTIFEALHDMSRPVDALRAARRMRSDDGTCSWPMGGSLMSSPSPPQHWNDLPTAGASFLPIHTDFWHFYRLLR
jgi:hypothetical protein